MNPAIIDLYDQYTHAFLDRRTFLEKLAAITGSVAAALALLPLLQNNYALAAIVPPDDARIHADFVEFAGASGKMRGYLAKPSEGSKKLPAILVIHENRGLNPHIQDVVRRCAVAGYLALGADALSPLGGTPQDEDKARDMIQSLDPAKTLDDMKAALAYLEKNPETTGKVGCIGFCWGGAMVNQLAVNAPNLDAAVAFYGRTPSPEDVPRIKAPLLLHYAGKDERINAGIPDFEKALKAAGKTYTIYVYEGVDHAFNNDTNEARYNKEAAELAWERTLEFLGKYLK